MAKQHVKNRIDEEVIEMIDAIAKKIYADNGIPVSQGQVIERAVRELHEKLLPVKRSKK